MRIRTERDFDDGLSTGPPRLQVQSYRSVLDRYLSHPESKSLAPDGKPVFADTCGLLQRRPVAALYSPTVIGKEGNKLFEQMYGLGSAAEFRNTYSDQPKQIWTELVAPVLQDAPLDEVAQRTDRHSRKASAVRNGPAPRGRNTYLVYAWAAVAIAQERLAEWTADFEPISAEFIDFAVTRKRITDNALAILRRYQQAKRETDTRIRCAVCQHPIESRGSRARYCSAKCRKQASDCESPQIGWPRQIEQDGGSEECFRVRAALVGATGAALMQER